MDRRKDILCGYFMDKNGVILTDKIKEEMTNELKELGLSNEKRETDFTFEYVKKKCREYNVCDFVSHRANKKDSLNDPNIIYRNKYLQIKLL